MNAETQQAISGRILRAVLAAAFGAYFVVLALLTYDSTFEGSNLFPTQLDRLTETYVSYLAPAGEIDSRQKARAWLAKARQDLKQVEQERLLFEEIETWIEVLSTLPDDWTIRVWRNGPDTIAEVLFIGQTQERKRAAQEDRKRFREACLAAGRMKEPFEKLDPNDQETFDYVFDRVFAAVIRKSLFLSGIAPRWEDRNYIIDRERGFPLGDLKKELAKRYEQLKAESGPSPFAEELKRLLDGADTLAEDAFFRAVHQLRETAAPEEAKKRILFFGPLCLRRLSEFLLSENEQLRKRAWDLVVEITHMGPDVAGQIQYEPAQQDDEDSVAGRERMLKKRTAAVQELAQLYWIRGGRPGFLTPELQNIYN